MFLLYFIFVNMTNDHEFVHLNLFIIPKINL
jgi:hypothetical protein